MLNKKYRFIIGALFILLACEEDIKVDFSEINISSENNKIVEVYIPNAIGNKDVATNINSAIEKIVIAALHIGEPDNITSKSIETSITAFNNEYVAFINDFPETSPPWEAQIDGEVLYQSPEIISVAITSYTNTGGAHGTLNISFENFNSQTGLPITNLELFNDIDAFKKLAKSYLDKSIENKNILFDPLEFELPNNIAYSEEGLILLYNTYEIAPYTAGVIEFVIPFNKAKSLLVFNSL
ncbi:MAG: DUF3298 and DUF4163 domain-containing protein [Flaviramulus sp.]|nr:DUF3298 and DUF4163 domain-containing protein [Flaviramulus sp.]NNC50891.1 DUF3298 and DUF4163 domain-containing protein [Flaviramulus sp.]